MQGSALIALFSGAAFISLSPIFVRVAEVGPTASAFWRVALAVPFLWLAFLSVSKRDSPVAVRHGPLLVAGFAFSGDLIFWHWSIQFTSVANSTLLANLASIFVTLCLWVLWRQRPKALFLAGLALALVGVAVLVRASLFSAPDALRGDGFGVVTAMFYAWYLLAVKGVREAGISTLYLMAFTSTVTALILFPMALADAHFSGAALMPPTWSSWLKLLGLALISHAAGQGLIAYALAHLPAGFSSAGLLLQPVMAALFAWLLLAEPLGYVQLAGGAAVLAGIYVARRGSS
jgi:drug/metabolite transporter (DMT)-like permease